MLSEQAIAEQIERLVEIMARLRGPNGCPWDKEQTYKDINPYMLEEVHEVMEAIDQSDFSELKEELGDLLMHIAFHCQLATEENRFTLADVAQAINEKLIRRHPHVFGEVKAKNSETVLANWEKIKEIERKEKQREESVVGGLPKAAPGLLKAFRLGEKAHRVGFDWSGTNGVLEKVDEELKELHKVIASGHDDIEAELGDLLFTIANLARHLKVDPETALRKAIARFIQRFQWIEQKMRQEARALQSLSAQDWDRLWRAAKKAT